MTNKSTDESGIKSFGLQIRVTIIMKVRIAAGLTGREGAGTACWVLAIAEEMW